MKLMLPSWLAALNRVTMLISALGMALIMFLITLEALLRYLFDQSLGWTYDLITLYIVVIVFFFAAPDTFARGGNVNVETLQEHMSWRWQAITELISSIMFIAVLGLILNRMWLRFDRAYGSSEVISGMIPWPTWPTWALAHVGFSLLLVNILVRLWFVVRALVRGEPIQPLNQKHATE